MTTIETLKHEHEVILLVLRAAEREAEAIERAGRFDADRLRKFVDFFREFVDRCHHHKEERHHQLAHELAGVSQKAGTEG